MKSKRKRSMGLLEKKNAYGYLFVAPVIIGIVFIYVEVMVNSLVYSFSSIKIKQGGYDLINVGLKNFDYALHVNPQFIPTLSKSLISMVTNLLIIVIFSLFMATILNQKFRGRTIARVIFFIPVIAASGLIGKLQSGDFILNNLTQSTGLDTGEVVASPMMYYLMQYMSFSGSFLKINIGAQFSNFIIQAASRLSDIITNSGVQILIFLAGLHSIPESVYEAAHVEGATGWEVFWKVTFPMISPLILVNIFYTVIDALLSESNPIMSLIYNLGIKNAQYGYASAMSWIYFGATSAVLFIVALVSSKLVFYNN